MCVASGVEINYFLFLHHSVPEDMTKFQPASYPIPAVCLSKLTSEQGAHEFNQVTSHPILSSQWVHISSFSPGFNCIGHAFAISTLVLQRQEALHACSEAHILPTLVCCLYYWPCCLHLPCNVYCFWYKHCCVRGARDEQPWEMTSTYRWHDYYFSLTSLLSVSTLFQQKNWRCELTGWVGWNGGDKLILYAPYSLVNFDQLAVNTWNFFNQSCDLYMSPGK